LAGLFAVLWFGGLSLVFRIAPVPEPLPHEVPAKVSWWPAAGGTALDVRALWTPAAFALSTPAGFSHSLRRERIQLAPPVRTERPAAAFLDPAPARPVDLSNAMAILRPSASSAPGGAPRSAGVFPPRVPETDEPRLVFPDGWESRLFSGIDLEFGGWTNAAWSARVEMRFDAKGVPVSVLLAQASGLPELDRRLARSATGWRLLEPAAPRTGIVAWSRPAPPASTVPASAAAEKGAE